MRRRGLWAAPRPGPMTSRSWGRLRHPWRCCVAGTGVGFYDRFTTAFRRFQDEFNQWGDAWDEKFHGQELRDRWFENEDLPALDLQPSRVDDAIDAIDAILVDVLLLAVLTVLFLMLSYLFFLGYDVT